jgi:hypothetical protein
MTLLFPGLSASAFSKELEKNMGKRVDVHPRSSVRAMSYPL